MALWAAQETAFRSPLTELKHSRIAHSTRATCMGPNEKNIQHSLVRARYKGASARCHDDGRSGRKICSLARPVQRVTPRRIRPGHIKAAAAKATRKSRRCGTEKRAEKPIMFCPLPPPPQIANYFDAAAHAYRRCQYNENGLRPVG